MSRFQTKRSCGSSRRRPGRRLDPLRQLAAVLRLAQVARDHDHARRSPRPRARRRARPCPRSRSPRSRLLASSVAEQRERRRPQPGAEDAVGDEGPVAHPRAAGDERRQRPHQADEAPDQDRLARRGARSTPRPARSARGVIRTFGPCRRTKSRPSRRPMKKLVVSPAQAQNQTIAIVITIDVSPWPATAPPRITAVSPGNTSPTKAPVSRKASSADQQRRSSRRALARGPRAAARCRCRGRTAGRRRSRRDHDRGDHDQPPAGSRFSPSSCKRSPIIGAAAAPRRSRSRSGAAAPRRRRRRRPGRRRARPRSAPSRRPATARRPTSSSAASASAICGPQRDRRLLEVVDEQLRVVERRRAARRPPRAAAPPSSLELRRRRARARARPPRRRRPPSTSPSSSGISTTANSPGAGSGSTTSPAPPTSANAGLELRRHVGAERPPRAPADPVELARGQPQHRGRVGAAAAEPGGDRDPLLDLDPQRRPPPAARAHRLERHRRPGSARRPRRRPPRPPRPPRSATSIRSASSSGQNSERSSCRPSSRRPPR